MKNKFFYLSILCWFLCVQAHAATITVKDATDNTSPTAIGHTLRSAIAAATDGDVIRFDASLNGVPIVMNSALGYIFIQHDISIIGNGIQNTIIDGNHTNSIFELGQASPRVHRRFVMKGVTLQKAADSGASSLLGGAISIIGTFDIQDCKFDNNIRGVVALNSDPAALPNRLENVQFVAHTSIATQIENTAGVPTYVRNCLFDGNQGFAMYLKENALVSNSVFSNNANNGAGFGAALVAYGATTIVNSIFVNNHSLNGGAAIATQFFGNLNVINSTIAGNTSGNPSAGGGFGGGIYAGSPVSLTNCIVAQNQVYSTNPARGNDIYTTSAANLNSQGGNLIGDGTNYGTPQVSDVVGTASVPVNPLFVDLANGNVHLTPCSPAINLSTNIPTEQGVGYDLNQDGSISGNLGTDQENNSRVIATNIDAGAYEYQGVINGAPVATFAYQGGFCQNGGIMLPYITNPGGVFSVTSGNPANLALNVNTGAIDLHNSAVGTYTVQYSVPDCNGGQVSQSTNITVYQPLTVQVYQQIGFNGSVSKISAHVQGGSGSYTYSWVLEGVVKSTTSYVSNPCSHKTYVLKVTDVNTGCVTSINYYFENRWNRCKEDTEPFPFPLTKRVSRNTGKDGVYPNPNTGAFNVSSAKGGIVRYEVYNMQGQVVASQRMDAQRVVKVTLQVKKGVYMLRAYTENNQVIQEKVVVK